MASCSRCAISPGFHTFDDIGRNKHGDVIYYTAPGKNIELQFTEESMSNYLSHMESAQGIYWVWIFDASGLQKVDMPNPVLMRRFYKTIVERYGKYLKYIYMINMNWKVEAIYNIIKTFCSEDTKRRVIRCKHPVDLVAAGIPTAVIEKVFQGVAV